MLEIIQECQRRLDDVSLEGPLCGLSFRSITLGPSRYLLCLLWLVHVAPLLSFFYLYYILDFSIALLVGLQLLSVVSLCYGRWAYRLTLGCRLCYEDTQWFWLDLLGVRAALELEGTLLWPNLVILYFRTVSGAARTVVIFSDAADADELRRLRVLLRL